jgi:hypothetical protein
MAKGSSKASTPTRGGRSARGAAPAGATKVGPPVLLLGLGYASILASLPLLSFDTIPPHIVGYVTGSLIPILVVGFVRRIDLGRRRSPYYVPNPLVQRATVLLAVLAVVAAGLHVWPIATELAS